MSALCPQCGAKISGPDALCPECLKRVALREAAEAAVVEAGAADDLLPETLARPARTSPSPECPDQNLRSGRFGDYEILQSLGQGAMGAVFKARHTRLNRLAALKLIRHGTHASKNERERFLREAEAAARLQHPHIVALYEASEAAGQPYLAMEYVPGKTLAQTIGDHPLPPRQAAECIGKISEAVHYAHEHGVLHRDLKPSNVMLDLNREPRVMDFGLARLTEQDSEMTLTGMAIGSPSYMSPEQASGRVQEVGAGSDVYALGAMLYEALTGRPPFQAESSVATMRQVMENEPVSPRLLNPGTPRDLETICLKCLAKEPQRRYRTAHALAEDLGRFLHDEPIHARPAGTAEKFWRWCRRNPELAATGTAALLAIALGFSGVLWQWRSAEAHRKSALQAKSNEELRRHQAEAQELAARRKAYASDMKLLQHALAVDDLGRAQELLDRQRPGPGEPDLRGWEWRYCWQFCQSDAAFTLGQQSNSIYSVSFSGDGNLLAVGSYSRMGATVWDLASRQIVYRDSEHEGTKVRLGFAPGGDTLAYYSQTRTGGNMVLWNSRNGTNALHLPVQNQLRELAFTTNGRVFTVEKSASNNIGVWNVASGAALNRLTARLGGSDMGTVFAISQDGNRVAYCMASDNRDVRVFDLNGGLDSSFRVANELITALAFSPDGRTLVTGSGYADGVIKLWEPASGRLVGALEGHRSWVSCLKFLPDGKTLASASADRTIRLWNFETRQPLRTLRGYGGEVWTLDVSPDGRWLASGGKDGSVILWQLSAATNRPPTHQTLQLDNRGTWAFSPDSKWLATPHQESLRLHDPHTLQLDGEFPLPLPNMTSMSFSPGAREIVFTDNRGNLAAWNLADRRPVTNFAAHSGPAYLSGWLSNGTTAVTFDPAARVFKEWDTANWRKLREWPSAPGVNMLSVSPAANLLVTGTGGSLFELIPVHDPEKRRQFNGQSRIKGMRLSPDGRTFAAASENGTVEVWDAETLTRRALLRGVLLGYHSVNISPDGERLVAGSNGQEAVKIWDLNSLEEVGTLAGWGSFYSSVAFSPDGNTIGARNWNRTLHLWRAPSWEEIQTAERSRR